MVQYAIDFVDNLEHIDCMLILLHHPCKDIDRWCDCTSYRMIQLHDIRTLQRKITRHLLPSYWWVEHFSFTSSYQREIWQFSSKWNRREKSSTDRINKNSNFLPFFYVSRFQIKSIWNEREIYEGKSDNIRVKLSRRLLKWKRFHKHHRHELFIMLINVY